MSFYQSFLEKLNEILFILVPMNLAPGEPVPPGFENEVKPVADLQNTIDSYKEQPLVGLEYIIELNEGSESERSYHCVLCETRGDPRTIMVHLISQNHRLKFLVSFSFLNFPPFFGLSLFILTSGKTLSQLDQRPESLSLQPR